MTEDFATDLEKQLLKRASKTVEHPRLPDLTAEVLQEITAKCGIDFATALLYDRAIHSKDHGPAITRLDELRQCQRSSQPAEPPQATFVVVPGAFYQEFPATGADGRILNEQAEKQGYRTATIPVTSTGTVSGNAKMICHWLDGQPDEKIILASVSKGGSDVKFALSIENAAHTFRNVVAWINVGGILDGSPMVNWLLSRRVRTLFYRSVFWLRRLFAKAFVLEDPNRVGKPTYSPETLIESDRAMVGYYQWAASLPQTADECGGVFRHETQIDAEIGMIGNDTRLADLPQSEKEHT